MKSVPDTSTLRVPKQCAPRSIRRSARRSKAGFTLIETLVGMALLVTCVAAMISMWAFSFNVTYRADMTGAAYLAGRRALERVKQGGYDANVSGTTVTRYYDQTGGNESAANFSGAALIATTQITDGETANLRAVTIRVSLASTGDTLFQTATRITKGGI